MPPAARSEVPLVAMSERGPCLLTERGVYLVKGLVTLPVGITCAIGFCFFILGCYLAVYPPIAVDRKEFLSCGIIISLIGLIYTLVPLQANYAFVTGGSTFGSGWTGKGVTSMFLLCNGAAVLCFIVIASLLALALNHFADVRDDDDAPYSPVETYVRDRFNNFFFYASKHCSEETLDWLWHWIGTYCPEGLHLNRCINCGYGVPFCRAHEQTCYAEDSIGRACPYSICRENFADYVVTAISAPFYGAVALYMSANIIMCTVFTIMHFTVLHDTAEASEHREKPACETDEFMIRDDKEYFIHVQPYEPNADDDGSTTVQLTTCSHDEADVATARKLKKAVVMDSVGKVLKTTILQYDPVTCTYDYLEPSDRSIVRGLERAHSVDSNESRISSTSSITVDDLLRRQAKGRIDLTNRALPPLPHHDASYSTSGLSMSRISGDESCSFNKESSDIINDDEEQCLRGSIEAGKSSPRMLELPPSRAPVSSCTTTPSGGSIGNMSQCGSYRSQRQMSSGSVVMAAAGAGLRTSARLTVMDRQHSGRRRTGDGSESINDDGESETDRMVFNFEDIPQHSNRSSCGFDSAKTSPRLFDCSNSKHASPVSGTPGSSPRSSMNSTFLSQYIAQQIESEIKLYNAKCQCAARASKEVMQWRQQQRLEQDQERKHKSLPRHGLHCQACAKFLQLGRTKEINGIVGSVHEESSDIINDDEEQCLRGSIEAGKSSPRMLELPPSRAPVSSCTTTPSGGSIGNMSQCGSYRSQRQMSSGSVVIAAAGAGLRTSARLTVMDRQHSGRRRTGDDGESETDRMVFNFEDIPQHSNRSSCGFDSAKTSPVSGTPGSSPRSSMNKTTRYIVEQIEPECGRSDSAESKQQQQNEV